MVGTSSYIVPGGRGKVSALTLGTKLTLRPYEISFQLWVISRLWGGDACFSENGL